MLPEIPFVDREPERAALEAAWRSEKAELVLVYGRRRIGKTRLLQEFLAGKPGWYFLADATENILSVFSAVASADSFARFGSWDDFFSFLLSESRKHRIVVVLDEFQYLNQVTKAWPTILQRWWDTELRRANIMLILCGSSLSVTYRIARGYGSALYGRKTCELELRPLPLPAVRELFPSLPPADIVSWYGILGGVPRYLEEVDPAKTIEANLLERVLAPTAFLAQEPRNLLFEEFKDVTAYSAILSAISSGAAKFNEVATAASIPSTKLSKYIGVLERIGIVRKEWPVTEKPRTRNTAYRIADPYYRFWFRFVFPNRSFLELGQLEPALRQIQEGLGSHIGIAFEEAVRDHLARRPELLPFQPKRIGRWWHADQEIDCAALDDHNLFVLEAKWRDVAFSEAKRIAERLRSLAQGVPGSQGTVHIGIAARSVAGKERLRADGILVLELSDLLSA